MKFSLIKNIYFETEHEEEKYESARGTLRTYLIGFLISILMTILAYAAVVIFDFQSITDTEIIIFIAICAVVQFWAQLALFLHLGSASKPRWKLISFGIAGIILAVILGGSIWAMVSLNNRMMPQNGQVPSSFTDRYGSL